MKKQLLFYSITTLLLNHWLKASNEAHYHITQLMEENAGLKGLNQKLLEEQRELKKENAELKNIIQTTAQSAAFAATVLLEVNEQHKSSKDQQTQTEKCSRIITV